MRPSVVCACMAMCLSACGGAGANIDFDPDDYALPGLDRPTVNLPDGSDWDDEESSFIPATLGIPSYGSAFGVLAAGRQQLERIDPMGLTAPQDFQRVGSAKFDGTIVLNDQSPIPAATVQGGFTITVDFADPNNVTGRAGNFFDARSERVTGTLDLDDVEFSEGTIGGGFVGNLNGTLVGVGTSGADGIYTYDVTTANLYYGTGVQGMLALVSGTATSLGSATTREISGGATLERD